MPHKRAKRSVREKERSAKGSDLAPGQQSLENEAIPKSIARVLNAADIRQQHKRKTQDEGDGGISKKRQKMDESKATQKIKPGESLQHFNKRVEQDMRPLVKTAVQSSLATARRTKAEETGKKQQKKKKVERSPSPSPPPPPNKYANRPKDFQLLSTSAPKRLNDIPLAPPELKLKQASKMGNSVGKKNVGVLSMAQKAMMEEEREKVIARYRQLKANRKVYAEAD